MRFAGGHARAPGYGVRGPDTACGDIWASEQLEISLATATKRAIPRLTHSAKRRVSGIVDIDYTDIAFPGRWAVLASVEEMNRASFVGVVCDSAG